jgi:alpha-1,3-mannosyltransferase
MQQVSQYLSGERDYTQIYGGTGPLVYPAVHVYIYSALYKLTSEGTDIFLAQCLFAILYIGTLCLVMATYMQARAPPYVLPMLVLSKRLHSIFVLRCFNDCFAAFFFWLAVFLLQKRMWRLGALAFSFGVGVKMSLLLALPAIGIVLFLGTNFRETRFWASVMLQAQVWTAVPFLRVNWQGYLSRAFELSRQFLFKWTVNWRFVGEEIFLSRPFSIALLALHASVLALFVETRWLKPSGKSLVTIATSVVQVRSPFALNGGRSLSETATSLVRITPPFSPAEWAAISRRITPNYILTATLSAMVIGMLFARSLHYQFYAYLAWASPFLLWRSGVHPIIQYAVWAAQEWAWNVYPSTDASSIVVVAALAIQTALIWWGTGESKEQEATAEIVEGKSYADAVKDDEKKVK